MRKIITLILILPLILLAPCSENIPVDLVNSPEELAKIKITNTSKDKEPEISFDSSIVLLPEVYSVISDGVGDVILDGDRLAIKSTTFQSVEGGEYKVFQSSWKSAAPANIMDMTSLPNAMPPGLYDGLLGKKVGCVFVSSAGSEKPESAGQANYIMVNKVVSKQKGYKNAEGKAIAAPKGEPKASRDNDGSFVLSIPDGYKPSGKLKAYEIIKGEGPKVKSSDTITVKYTGWLLDGTIFDYKTSSPFVASLNGSVIQGWSIGLNNKTVGSRVMLVIPPNLGYGENAIGKIPANSTLVFVVDILGIN